MQRNRGWIALILGALVLAPFSLAQNRAPHRPAKRRAAQKQAVTAPPQPVGALQQVPLDQVPATAPQVRYEAGLLSIAAQNSTLSDILREVQSRTGASIDMPPNANERVVAHLGPGPARDVLASLLNGTSYNYVMVGSASDPKALSNLVLTAKPASGESSQTVAMEQPVQMAPPARMGGPPGFVPPPQAVVQQQAEDNADEAQDADENGDQEQAEGQPEGQPDPNAGAPQGIPQPNAGPKTPEQILEMLRKPAVTPANGQGVPQQPENQETPPD